MFGIFTSKKTQEVIEKKVCAETLLSEKLRELACIEDLNSGGCAIAALGLYEYIQREHPELEPKIVYLFRSNDDDAEAIAAGFARSCAHAVLEIDGKYVDSGGFQHRIDALKRRYLSISIEVSPELVLESINKSMWNPWFERDYGVPKISKALSLGDSFESKIEV